MAQRYLQRFPDDRARLRVFLQQLEAHETLQGRTNFTGHVTAGAIVLSPDLQKVLLIHHRFLDKWFQPGGHWDVGEVSPRAAARREAEEETAVRIGRYVPLLVDAPDVPLHIDTHHIPANPAKKEPAHYHHDFRYVFVAADERLTADEREIKGVRWLPLGSVEIAGELDEVLRRARLLLLN